MIGCSLTLSQRQLVHQDALRLKVAQSTVSFSSYSSVTSTLCSDLKARTHTASSSPTLERIKFEHAENNTRRIARRRSSVDRVWASRTPPRLTRRSLSTQRCLLLRPWVWSNVSTLAWMLLSLFHRLRLWACKMQPSILLVDEIALLL